MRCGSGTFGAVGRVTSVSPAIPTSDRVGDDEAPDREADERWSAVPARRDPATDLSVLLRKAGLDPWAAGTGTRHDDGVGRCPVQEWAQSGAMACTGWADEPAWPDGDVIGALAAAGRVVTDLAGRLDRAVAVDPGALLCARIARRLPDRATARRGATSLGGRCRMLRASDGWVAVNLCRPDDVAVLPALTDGRVDTVHGAVVDDDLWDRLAGEVADRTASEFVGSAQELGVPASQLGEARGAVPWVIERLGERRATPPPRPTVVDFTALWAGPLCAQLLHRAGAQVTTVESRQRPDLSRVDDPEFFADLRQGTERVVVDFATPTGRRRIQELVASADVVLEGSRPRALAGLGLGPEEFLRAGGGRIWVSLTGYGRRGAGSHRVAFGDDAGVAGGLVAHDRRGRPLFCADAVADPVSGLLAAAAALSSLVTGGGHLVECSMAGAAAWAGSGDGCAGRHRVERRAATWVVYCDDHGVEMAEPSRLPGRRVERAAVP